MNYSLSQLILIASTVCLLATAACDKQGGHAPQPSSGQPTTQNPALQFKKIAVGLPSNFIGVVGKEDYGIAGAADGNKVYYAVYGEKGYEIHVTDLTNGRSAKVTDSNDLVSRTLTSDPQGKRLMYTRLRKIESYVDNPNVIEPPQLAIIYSYDVGKGEETPVFEFKDGEWLHYRGSSLAPMLSNSGKRAATLSFDVDRDMVMRDLDEWLGIAPGVVGGKGNAADRHKNEERMHKILAFAHIFPLLKDAGITIGDTDKFTLAHIGAVKKLRDAHMVPQWAVLLNDGGEPKLLKITVPAKYQLNPLSLLAVGDHTVLLATQGKSTTGYPEVDILRVDEETGEASDLTSFIGAPQTVLLDNSDQTVLITYLGYDAASRTLGEELSLRTVPLDNPAAATEAPLFAGIPSSFAATNDPLTFALQSASDNTIYFAKAGGAPEKLAELMAPVDGMFLTSNGEHLVYAENGVLLSINVKPNAEQSAEWVDASQFAPFDTEAKAFLARLGYQVPADVVFHWEERDGFGQHEAVGLAVSPGADAESGALLRYNVTDKRFESLYFPGTSWPNTNLTKASVDAPEAEKRAGALRTAAGWLSDKAQKYQPGPNPLYDGKTSTYVLVFRDGYLIETPQGKKEAINGEVTVRVHKDNGQVVEISLQTMPEVKTANFKATKDDILSAIRNKGREKYPQDAPMKIKVDDASLIVARDKKPQYAPAQVETLGDWRLAWAVDTFIQPEDELIFTTWVDVENTSILGQLYFLPTSTTRMGL